MLNSFYLQSSYMCGTGCTCLEVTNAANMNKILPCLEVTNAAIMNKILHY